MGDLFNAIAHEDESTVSALLAAGAAVNIKDSDGSSPVLRAVELRQREILRMLLDKSADANAANSAGETPLHLAARASGSSLTRLLLERGATPNVRDSRYSTPLHWAATAGNVEATRLLLEHGAKVDALTDDKSTALHFAAASGAKEVIQVLLERNAVIEAATAGQQTPLHVAAVNGRGEAARLLLVRGAKVDALDRNQQTPLHLAAVKGQMTVIKTLLERGARADAADGNGKTPLELAVANQHTIAASLLSAPPQSGASKAPFRTVAKRAPTDAVKMTKSADAVLPALNRNISEPNVKPAIVVSEAHSKDLAQSTSPMFVRAKRPSEDKPSLSTGDLDRKGPRIGLGVRASALQAKSPAVKSGLIAKAIYDYTAKNDNELSFSYGEYIIDVDKLNKSQWRGTISSKSGLFAADLVKEVPNAELSVGLVLHAFAKSAPDELELKPGQVVRILKKRDNGWWRGMIGSRVGLFPSTHVQEYDRKALKVLVTRQPYASTRSDELSIDVGDLVTVHSQSDDSPWWIGSLPDGTVGFFPSTHTAEQS